MRRRITSNGNVCGLFFVLAPSQEGPTASVHCWFETRHKLLNWEPAKESPEERMKRRCEELERYLCTRKKFDAYASTTKCEPPRELSASYRRLIAYVQSFSSNLTSVHICENKNSRLYFRCRSGCAPGSGVGPGGRLSGQQVWEWCAVNAVRAVRKVHGGSRGIQW